VLVLVFFFAAIVVVSSPGCACGASSAGFASVDERQAGK